MLIVHRIMINVRRTFLTIYYKLIYGRKFEFGDHFKFRGAFRLYLQGEGHITFGNNVFLNNYFSATSIQSIRIGDNCIFGEGVKIYDHNHNHDFVDRPIIEQGLNSDSIEIGDNCWIGSNVTILSGVHIGANSIIGANSLIYRDIPANSLVMHKEELIITVRN